MAFPVGPLLVEQPGEVEQRRIAGAVVQPDHAHELVGPAVGGPLVERTLAAVRQVVGEVPLHQRDHAGVAGDLLVLRECLEHHHVRPPVGVLWRTDASILALVGQRPFHPGARLRDEALVSEQVGERNEAIDEVRAALPALAGSAKPPAVLAHIRPELVEMPGQTRGLDLQLPLQPASRTHGAERKRHERLGPERLPVEGRSRRRPISRSRTLRRRTLRDEAGDDDDGQDECSHALLNSEGGSFRLRLRERTAEAATRT